MINTKKVVEGIGSFSGSGNEWRIKPLDIEPELGSNPGDYYDWESRVIYPQNILPDDVSHIGWLHGKPVKYKIIVEIEELVK